MSLYKEIIKLNDLCFDIGANNGNKTQEMLNCGAKVIAIEPQTICFSKLKEKFENNQNVILINKSVSFENGVGEIYLSNAHTVSTMSLEFINKTQEKRFSGIKWEKTEQVITITLDEIIKLYGMPDFCKIDVEGFEYNVLLGLTKKIKILSIEFTPELKKNSFECIKLLNNIGNYKFNYSEGENGVFLFEDWLTSDDIISFLEKNNDYVYSFGDIYSKIF